MPFSYLQQQKHHHWEYIDIEKLYSNYKHWQLDTIKEEKKNVHLYQKLGYKPNGKEKIINDKMTITEFEKEINDERSN